MILDEFLWKLGFLADTAGAQVATAALANVSSAADDAAGAVNQAASGVNKGTGSIVSSLGMWMAALSGVGAGIALLSGGLSSFIEDAVSQLEDLDETAGKSARSAVDEAKERLVEAGEQITSMFLDIRRQAILTVLPYLDAIVSKIREWYAANRALIEGTLTKLKDVIGRIGGAIGNTVSFIAKVIYHTTGWKAALALLAAGFIYLKRQMIMSAAAKGLALLMSPLTLIAAAIAGIVLLVDDFMTYLDGGKSELGTFWDPFVAAIPKVKAWIDGIKATFSEWWSENGDAIIGFASMIWNAITSVVRAVFDFIVAHWDQIAGIFSAGVDFITAMFKGLAGVIKAVFGLLSGDTTKIVDGLGEAWSAGIDAWTALADGFGQFLSVMFDAILDIASASLTAMGNVFSVIWSAVVDIVSAAFNAILALFAPAINCYSELFGAIGDLISGNFEGAFNRVTALWDQTVGTIAAGVQKVIGFFTSIGQSLGLLNGKTIEVAQKVAVTASATPGAVIGAQNAARPQSTNPAASLRTSQPGTGQGSNINQDVKMNIYTSDPERAGKAAADEMRRQQQLATRNASGAVKY
ncbi:hypothetical protein LH425_06625 [Laribacter hongkongensis]|uniref:phage tail protein n=1 Tax=Laribacter hongkongensis TaxID=168471 RepID=UPI001EFD0247|nr:hypothetical protein [Laribacter hongkongensis]MCG9064718.1 hypothetical protein [Laribacter hongkongensis]